MTSASRSACLTACYGRTELASFRIGDIGAEFRKIGLGKNAVKSIAEGSKDGRVDIVGQPGGGGCL